MLSTDPAWDFILGFALTLLVIPVLMRLAPFLGLLDQPDARKQHRGSVPLVGGIAVGLGLGAVLAWRHFGAAGIREMLAAGLLLLAIGVVDDRDGMTARIRFVVQTFATCLMVFGAGVLLADFGQLLADWTLPLGWFAIPVTLFCVVGATNAMNMIDGMDGLAASLLLVALVGLAVAVGAGEGSLAGAPEIPVLAGAVVAYLAFNLRWPGQSRARIFFGDAGTLLLGFLLAWLLVRHSQGADREIAPVTALWLFALPLMDTVFLMIRRRRRGRSMIVADREHLHHAFLRAGWGINATLLLIVAAAAVLAALGLWMQCSGLPEYVAFYAFLVLSGAYYFLMNRVWNSRRLFGRELT